MPAAEADGRYLTITDLASAEAAAGVIAKSAATIPSSQDCLRDIEIGPFPC